jgi:hypothetical protein
MAKAELHSEISGAGGAVLGHPAVAVAWLANAVGQFGVSLSAGDIIMPGALCGAVDVVGGRSAASVVRRPGHGLGPVRIGEIHGTNLRGNFGFRGSRIRLGLPSLRSFFFSYRTPREEWINSESIQ